ncbi:DUF5936 domain-containing protein [soil metagenome]
MTPAVVGLASLLIYGVALTGWRLSQTPSMSIRFVDVAGGNRTRRSLVGQARAVAGRALGPFVLRSMGQRARRRIEHWLDASGRPNRLAIADVAELKAADVVTCFTLGVAILPTMPLAMPLITMYGYFRQDLNLRTRAKVRQIRIERDLPDYLDILAVTVQAGLKFRGALRRVGEEFDSPVADEFRIALQQMDVGASRRAAFEGVRERNDSPSLSRFVGALLQAEELGAPLTDAMVAIGRDMRKSFGQDVRKRAAKAVPKVTLVATALLMPGAALLLLGGMLIGSDIDLGGVLGG